jgi:hypothetical protein
MPTTNKRICLRKHPPKPRRRLQGGRPKEKAVPKRERRAEQLRRRKKRSRPEPHMKRNKPQMKRPRTRRLATKFPTTLPTVSAQPPYASEHRLIMYRSHSSPHKR